MCACVQLCKKAFGQGIGSYSTSGGWCNGCYVDSTAASLRRSTTFTVTYEAGVNAALESNATAAADAITITSFHANLASINTAEALVASGDLPQAMQILAATSSNSGNFFSHWIMGVFAVVLMVLLLLGSFCAIHYFKQSTKKPEVNVDMNSKTVV